MTFTRVQGTQSTDAMARLVGIAVREARQRSAQVLVMSVLACGLALIALPPPPGLSAQAANAAGIIAIFIALLSSGLVRDHVASIMFLFGATMLAVAPRAVLLSGFSSTASWLVFGGLIVGTAVQRSGLGEAIARAVVDRFSGGYLLVLCGIVACGLALAFLVPSALARVILIMPVAIGLANRLGFPRGSSGYSGIVVAAAASTIQPSYCILTGNFPNLVMLGIGERLFGVHVSYTDYLIANFAVLGLGSALAIVVVTRLVFPAHLDRLQTRGEQDKPKPVGRDARTTLLIACAAVALWITDSLHGVSPAWIALGAALACLAPPFGPLRDVPFSECMNFGAWILIGTVMGIGAVASHAGLGDAVAATLLPQLLGEAGHDVGNYYRLTLLSISVTALSTTGAASAILTPMAETIATATGWPILTVMFAQLPGLVFFPLPYAVTPMLVAVSLANVRLSDATKVLLGVAAAGLLVVLPLHIRWMAMLGYLP